VQVVAKDVEQRSVGFDLDGVVPAVDVERKGVCTAVHALVLILCQGCLWY